MKRNKILSSFNFVGIYLLLLIFFSSQSNALAQQSNGFCGIPQKSGPRSIKPNDKHLDRFGYGYTDEDLDIGQFAQLHYNTCSTEYFNLIFNPDYKQAAQEVVCAVFMELENTIDMSKVGINKINILVGKETDKKDLPDNVIGAASFYWSRDKCGIASSYVQKIITGGLGFYSPTQLGGYIIINDNTNCFNKSTTITSDCYLGVKGNPLTHQIDLYSVIMHEALHILGIASLIEIDGKPDNDVGAYSRWDKFLTKEIEVMPKTIPATYNYLPLLENNVTAPECCDKHKFSSSLKEITVVDECQDKVRFLSRTDLIVSNNSKPADYSSNTLSHLISNDCIIDNSLFVMTAVAKKGKRLSLTMAEKEILCAIGYTLKGIDCNPQTNSCTVLANDDNLSWWIETQNSSGVYSATYNISDLLTNDIYPTNYTIEFDNIAGLTFISNGTTLTVSSTLPGYYLCTYKIKGCNNTWCDYATFSIVIGKSPSSCSPNSATCEAICYGDFRDFTDPTYIKNTRSDLFMIKSISQSQNTPDVIKSTKNGNTYVGFLNWNYGVNDKNKEAIILPLARPLQSGCIANISLVASSFNSQTTLHFYGLDKSPKGLILDPPSSGTNNISTDASYSIFATNMTGSGIPINHIGFLPAVGRDNVNFTIGSSLSFNFENTSNKPITHIIAFCDNANLQSGEYTYAVVDDVQIHISCNSPIITVQSIDSCLPVKNDKQTAIRYSVSRAVTTINTLPSSVTLKIDKSKLPQGVNIVNGADFSAIDGTCTFDLNSANPTEEKYLLLEANTNYAFGTEFIVDLAMLATNACNGNVLYFNSSIAKIGENADFTAKQANCTREVQFTASISKKGIHNWNFGNGTLINNTIFNPNVYYSQILGNQFIVTHTIDNSCGYPYRKSLTVNIASGIPSATFTVTKQCSKIICNSTAMGTHSWDFGDGTPPSPNNVHDYLAPGKYKIIHTVTNLCGISTPFEVEVIIDDINSLADFTAVVNGCSVVCTSATKTGTHEWIFQNNGTSNLVDPTYGYSKSGSYFITHIVINPNCPNQLATKTISVTTKCSEFTYTKKTDVCGDSYTFTSQNPSPGTHLWNFGDGTTSNEANPTIMFPKSGQYIVKHTLTVNGFSHTNIEVITVVVNRNVLKKDVTTSTQQNVLKSTGKTVNEQFTVTGIYYIDKDYTFEDCDFFMTEGSGIIINEDIKAEFSKNCTFQACGEKMWRGIFMEKNSFLSFTDNIIEDADYAITLGNKCLVDIKSNIFNANHIGLYTYSTQGSGNPPTIVYQQDDIKNNTFKCDRPLKNNFSTWIDCGDLKCVGICFNDLASGIRIGGLTAAENNTFTKLDCAIVSKRSDLFVQFADISHLNQMNAGAVPQQGVGIYLEGGYNTVVESNFSDMFLAIAGEDDNSVIWKNTISEVVLGMSIADAVHKETYVIDNTINFNAGGIISDQINFPEMLSIEDNTLNHTQNYPTWFYPGIMLSNMVADPDKANIKRSTITMGNDATSKIGIWSFGGKNITIQSNQIKLNNNSSIGIGVGGFGGASVGGNQIKANVINGFNAAASGNLAYPSHIGITSSFSPEDFYSCNQIFNTEAGIRFSAYSNNSNLETTILHNHHRGLVLSQDAVIGPQDHTGNQWVGTNTSFADAFHDSNLKKVIDQSQFLVTQGNTFEPKPVLMPNAPPATQWVIPDASSSIFCPLFKAEGTIAFGTADDAIAAGTLYDNTTYETANTYEAKHHLFSKLDRISNLSEVSPNLRAFYENTKNAPLGAFYELQKRVENALKGSSSFRQAQHNHLMSMDSLRASINQLSIQISTASNENKAALLVQRKVLNNQLAAEHTVTEANYQQYVNERNQALTFIMADMSNLEEGNDFILQNEKIFYVNYIAILMHDAYYNSRVEWDAVKSLAEQCPFKGGSVVYRARGLYMRKNPNVVYNDDIKCTTGGRPIGKVQYIPKEDFNVSIYPNPANENINIILNKSNNNTVFITLTDILGKVLFNANTVETNFIIDTSMFPSGPYQIKVNTEDNNNVNVSKIIINH